jgi:hypothetical protein
MGQKAFGKIVKVHCFTMENTPEETHTMRDRFTEPVLRRTPVGETKIPDPMILPTITVIPFNRLIFALRQIWSSPDVTAFFPAPSFPGTSEYFCLSRSEEGILPASASKQY